MSIGSVIRQKKDKELLALLIALAAPLARIEVLDNNQGFEIYQCGASLGTVWPDGDGYGVSRVGIRRIEVAESEEDRFESVTRGHASLPTAVRALFGLGNPPEVKVQTNLDEVSGHNATLQPVGDVLTFSVATHVEVPAEVVRHGSVGVGRYLHEVLTAASSAAPGVRFDIQVGNAIS